MAILALYAAVATLSALQIQIRLLLDGAAPDFAEVVIQNFVAWLPWCPLAVLTLWIERRIPIRGPSGGPLWQALAIHAGVATGIATTLLLTLTLFRFHYFPDVTGALDAASFATAFGREVGDFFLEAVGIYGLIVAAGALSRPPSPEPAPSPPSPHRIEIRSSGGVRWIRAEDIDWAEAAGSYVRLHHGEGSVLLRKSLRALAGELEAYGFARVHRSSLVNLERVVAIERLTHGEAMLELASGKRIKTSRTYRQALDRLGDRSG